MPEPPAQLQSLRSSAELFAFPFSNPRFRESPLPRDPRSHSLHHLHHFLKRHHRSVARCRHGKRSVRRSTLHAPLWFLSRQESINQARGKRISSAHAVKNLQILPVLRLVKLPVAITNRAPII